MSALYLDHNASSPVRADCIARMVEVMESHGANPSAKHGLGQAASGVLETARRELASLLSAEPRELVFTSGGTEANHQAILGALALQGDKRHVITSEVEHASSLVLLHALEQHGVRVTRLAVDRHGLIALDALRAALCHDTALVTLQWANNETGVVQPIAALAALAHDRGVLFHSDAVQAVARLKVDMRALPIDMLSLSGHKFGAPSGTGALFIRKGLALPPLLHGHQERGRRAGTPNLPGLAALGVAAVAARDALAANERTLTKLRDQFETTLKARLPGVVVNGQGAPRLCNTSSCRFAGIDAEWVLARLEKAEIYAAAGSACTSAGTLPSHVLLAMGLGEADALATVRFSLGPEHGTADVARLLDCLTSALAQRAA